MGRISTITLFLCAVVWCTGCQRQTLLEKVEASRMGGDVALTSAESDSLWRMVVRHQHPPHSFQAAYQLGLRSIAAASSDATTSAEIKTTEAASAETTKGSSIQLSGQLRYSGDSVLWLSGKWMGIEAFRAWITPDSAYLINRMEREIYAYKIPTQGVNVSQLMASIMLGSIPQEMQQIKPVYSQWLPKSESSPEVLRFGLKIDSLPKMFDTLNTLLEYEVAASDFHLRSVSFAGLKLTYQIPDGWTVRWSPKSGKGTEINMTYSKQKWNEPVSVDTEKPKKYKIIYEE